MKEDNLWFTILILGVEMLKKILSGFLAIAITLSVLPFISVFAATSPDGVDLTKSAARVGSDEWEVTLKVDGNETAKKPTVDVVLLLDNSYSMYDVVYTGQDTTRIARLKTVAKNFVTELAWYTATTKVGIVTFESTATSLPLTDVTNLTSLNKATIIVV